MKNLLTMTAMIEVGTGLVLVALPSQLVSICNTNSYMLYPWAGGRNHAQELPCAKVL